MTLKTRKRLALLVLLIGLPLYIVAALYLVDLIGRPSILIETMIYVILGILWALPLRSVFRGVARDDPDG